MAAIANTRIFNSTAVGNRVADIFEWTPKMSTYLLAFIVSKYESLQSTDSSKPFGVFARPQAKAQANVALDFGIKMLDKFNAYLGIDYYAVQNITKMDMAAIPDFSAGGEFD